MASLARHHRRGRAPTHHRGWSRRTRPNCSSRTSLQNIWPTRAGTLARPRHAANAPERHSVTARDPGRRQAGRLRGRAWRAAVSSPVFLLDPDGHALDKFEPAVKEARALADAPTSTSLPRSLPGPGRSGHVPTRAAGNPTPAARPRAETPRVRVHYVSWQSGRGFQKKHMRQVNSKCHNLESI